MSEAKKPQWNNPRGVIERVFIRGTLTLETPANFGNGDAEGTTDISLLKDSLNPEKPLLTGASIAGALRNYLREVEQGYGWSENRRAKDKSTAEQLFGYLDDSDEDDRAAVESWLMIDDAIGQLPEEHAIEIRDGVAIDPKTRTVEINPDTQRGSKYDFELLAAGTSFDLSFEYWRAQERLDLLSALVRALQGLEEGAIGLGLRKRRGFGRCRAGNWQVWRYRMDSIDGLVGWLRHNGEGGKLCQKIANCFEDIRPIEDSRRHLRIEAEFELDGSLLIRADVGGVADKVHLQSPRNRRLQPVLSGTSLAGAVRARALRIANTFHGQARGAELVDSMFGKRIGNNADQPSGSLVGFDETLIENDPIIDQVQSRVKIDRFTGGAYPQALFNRQPAFSAPDKPAKVKVGMTLRRLHDDDEGKFETQAGLLLLVLKDLWTGDLPLGGESSVGRGRLKGKQATISFGSDTWTIEGSEKLNIAGDKDKLEKYVEAFVKEASQ